MQAESSAVPAESVSWTFPPEQLETALQTIIQLYMPARPPQHFENTVNGTEEGAPRPAAPSPPKPISRVMCGERLFEAMPREKAIEFFRATLEYVPQFVGSDGRPWQMKNGLGVDHILIQSFLCWVMNCNENKGGKKKKDNRPKPPVAEDPVIVVSETSADTSADADTVQSTTETALEAVASKSDRTDVFSTASTNIEFNGANGRKNAPVVFSHEQKWALVRTLVRVNFPANEKIWYQIVRSLNIPKNQIGLLVSAVCDAADAGLVSFTALVHILSDQNSWPHIFTPKYLIQALLLGPLRRVTVESFLSTRDTELRAEAKRLLLEAEKWTQSLQEWEKAVNEWAHTTPDRVPRFTDFRESMQELMRDLRREQPKRNIIDYGWALRAVQMAAKRYYISGQWAEEQFNDVVQTILIQRPEFKMKIANILKKEYNDVRASNKWRTFKPMGGGARQFDTNFQKVRWHESAQGYLALPADTPVYFVDKPAQIKLIENDLDMCLTSGYPVVGLDAEWSSYVGSSRASILQIAFRWVVYIVDLDALYTTKRLVELLDGIFARSEILKIGFQFGEDLFQMRERVNKCQSLFRPDNLICIGRLVADMMVESSKRNFNLNQILPAPEDESDSLMTANANGVVGVIVQEESLAAESSTDTTTDDPSTAPARAQAERERREEMESGIKNMGMSALCKRVLGLPLDKTEQCSVWDRRPLRDLQLRYAALDAYCCLMLYDKCREWAEKMGLSDGEFFQVLGLQNPIRVALPLFWEGTEDATN